MFSYFKCITILMFLTLSIYASEIPNIRTKNTQRKFYDQGYGVSKHKLMQAYNAPARVNLPGKYDFFVEGNFIWWQPKEKGLDFALTTSKQIYDTPSYKLQNFKANFKNGFKTGIGFHHYFDDWTFFLQYTYYKKTTMNLLKKTQSFFSQWIENNANEIIARWHLKFNFLELEISRKNLTGKDVVFSPHFTISGGWIDQNFNIFSFSNNSFATSKSWLIGPKSGIQTFWIMKSNFKLLANISGALFFQNYKKIKYEVTNNISFANRIIMKTNYLTPNLNFSSGFSYENCFMKRTHITLVAMYEFLHFWNQNQMRYLLNTLNNTKFDAGNLILHGITASLRWDF